MLNYFQILILALIQGACELLPVSSSAHVIVAEKLMGLDPSSPEMTMLLVMLHTGTMFAVIVYFWNGWKRDYFASTGQLQWFAIQVVIATVCTGVVGYGLKVLIEKIFMRGVPHAEIEDLFSNLPLIAGALAAVGVLIIYAGLREEKSPRHSEIQPPHSRLDRHRAGNLPAVSRLFAFRLDHFHRPAARPAETKTGGIQLRAGRGLDAAGDRQGSATACSRTHALSGHGSVLHLFVPGLVGMVFSFIAGLLALKWLSRWLEGGRWKFFGYLLPRRGGGRAGDSLQTAALNSSSSSSRNRIHHSTNENHGQGIIAPARE